MTAQSPATRPTPQATGKYLMMVLAGESYGIAVMKVREIIRMQKITPVPRLPGHVKGVFNLRGRVIPVIDLRVRFGLAATLSNATCIVVVQVKLPTAQTVQMGLIVDGVSDVLNLTDAEIEPTPDFGSSIDARYILGMAKVKDQVCPLLDIDRLVAPEPAENPSWSI